MKTNDHERIKALSERKTKFGEIPLVSISCLVYNHEKFLRKTLESFLMQKTNFLVEILLHDDASTDNSPQIIREYQKRFPLIIKPIFQEKNQYSMGVKPGQFNMERATGKYYALCEGDDYWLSPYKLQKQVDFLERNKKYSLCVGGYIKYDVATGKERKIIKSIPDVESNKEGFTFTLDEMKKGWLTQTLTAIYRRDKIDLSHLPNYRYGRDINLFYHLLKDEGKGFYFNEIMGVYRVHKGGINSMNKGRINNNEAYRVYKELYQVNKDDFTRHRYIRHTLNLLNYNLFHKYPGNDIKTKLNLFIEALEVIRTRKEWVNFFSSLLPETLKSKLRKKKSLVKVRGERIS